MDRRRGSHKARDQAVIVPQFHRMTLSKVSGSLPGVGFIGAKQIYASRDLGIRADKVGAVLFHRYHP
jgi:hypothetical protein